MTVSLTSLKNAVASVEASVKADATKVLGDVSILKKPGLWLTLGAIVALIVLYRLGIVTKLHDDIVWFASLLLVLHYIGAYIADLGNAKIEVARIAAGLTTDPAPAPESTGDPVSLAQLLATPGTTVSVSSAPVTPVVTVATGTVAAKS